MNPIVDDQKSKSNPDPTPSAPGAGAGAGGQPVRDHAALQRDAQVQVVTDRASEGELGLRAHTGA